VASTKKGKDSKKKKGASLHVLTFDHTPEGDEILAQLLIDIAEEVRMGKINNVVGVFLDEHGEEMHFAGFDPGEELKLFGALTNLSLSFRDENLLDEWEE
jgi:hypothetical protein